jgi:peptidoglycan/LPS O-acetylase OafA/YrhL
VLSVVLHHIHLRFALNHYDVATLAPKPLARVMFWSGYYAVIVFFVISGFLITTLSIERWRSLARIDVRAFYALRFARIFPCLVALLAVLSILHLAGATDYVIDPSRSSLVRAIVAALTFHFNWLEGTRGYLPGSWDVLWSLSIEEAFYVAFPLICIALRREALALVPIAALIVIGPFSRVFGGGKEPWDEYAYLSCMDGIAFGCLAALIHARIAPSRMLLRIAFVCGCVAMLLVVAFRQTTVALGLVSTGLYITVLELGAALALLGMANGMLARLWSARGTGAMRAIGRRSYEIYLTHMFVVFATVALFKATGAHLNYIWLWYAGAMTASVLLGYAIAKYYSAPANAAIRARLLVERRHATAASAEDATRIVAS